MLNLPETFAEAAALDAHIAEVQEQRRKLRHEQDRQAAVLYPHVRTFVLKESEAIGAGESAAQALARAPRTMTLVTPNLADPSRDHWFVGPYPVLSRDVTWKPAFDELDFATSDGTNKLRGHLRLTHSRSRAYGVLDVGGESISVEYQVDPQRYSMKVAEGAAFLSGPVSDPVIDWNTESKEWKDADWPKRKPELEFTFGVNGEEIIGGNKVDTFVASFLDDKTGRDWVPDPFTYGGFITSDSVLIYSLLAGNETPSGPGSELFPYTLRIRLSEFAYDFEGGVVVGKPGYQGTVYGCIGTWAGAHIGGLYRLGSETPARFVSVHGRTFYAGVTPAAQTAIEGSRLTWSGLPAAAAAEAGIPSAGFLDFSPDGWKIVGGSISVTGTRVHADEVQPVAGNGALPAVFARTAAAEEEHTLKELLALSQFGKDPLGKIYDEVQQDSMEDFYAILQNYMDPTLRRTFFNPGPPPPLDAELRAIAQTKGTKGTEPLAWYNSLSVPYTATAVGKFSTDPWAATLNAARSEAWMSTTTAASDVMAAQGPLLYRRRYLMRHQILGWFLKDQHDNAAKYAPFIDEKLKEWIARAREQNVGTPAQLAELEKQFSDLAAAAKRNKKYWAFAIYTYTLTPAYLNFLQTILSTRTEDGSEFSLRVQRTVALLGELDPSNLFAQAYGHVLQLFQLGRLLPQMMDSSTDLPEFNFALEQVLNKFIETYVVSPDPSMRAAAEELRKYASKEFVGRLLSIMHTAAAVGYGLFNWGFLVSQVQNDWIRNFGTGVPSGVVRLAALGTVSTLVAFLAVGSVDWNALSDTQKAFVVVGAVNVTAVNLLPVIKFGVSWGTVWNNNRQYFSTITSIFSPAVIGEAQKTAIAGFRGWLLQEAGPRIPLGRHSLTQWWAARQAGLFQKLKVPKSTGQILIRAIFGKNLSRFLATRVAAVFSITGIVLSAIDLSKSGEPMERAINSLFLIAAALELVAVIGGWAFAGSTLAVGGMLVSSMFPIIAGIGFLAFLAGAILLIVLLTRPRPSPVQQFAEDQAKRAGLYMQYKAAIETFAIYVPIGQPQRAGIALYPDGDNKRALTIGADGSVKQGPFDSSGHTAFYIDVDFLGRTKIGAPITDNEDKLVLQTLGTDDGGTIVSRNFQGDNLPIEPRLMWYAEIQGPGTYEKSEGDAEHLESAPFKLRSIYWDDQKMPKYLATNGTNGWRLVDKEEDATVITMEMVAVKPAELAMRDVSWLTVAREEQTAPALYAPGSLPRTWSIDPALPEALELLPEDGTIQMRKATVVPPAARRTYQLTVKNDIGSASTSFDLEVRVPEYPPVAA
jgi:hypothetical protein